MDGKVDYSSYSLPQLTEALSLINKAKYPRNYQNLSKEIAARSKSPLQQSSSEQTSSPEPDPVTPSSAVVSSTAAYSPNSVPLVIRAFNILASLGLLAYGAYGIYANDLYIPGKRGRGVHLHDGSALVMFAAFVCACLIMLSVVMDHHDKKNNEHKYETFADTLRYIGWSLFGASLLMSVFG